ncbi:MAG: glycosyl transferase [Parcubacteria group bacterium GW2011_GWD2_38_11]|uniref:Glycosyl transferase n=1 Tax=Candidatus Magasanikbacteria bacterium GW2011_GWE2_42_7 TaxID=1619052 RepID=A0A0G1BAN9_9BACT|nr:MAG: glycosyl transferase [Parcubacteria group bacterium GW2011_GWD2_38_11]KKS70332.1 MAG: glycosyl transferase [Candidatus Magasanikbacteria bacterium GW2011_GWE2_42_7]
MIKYSFIIPVKAINDYVREAVSMVLNIPRDDYEIIVYPDEATGEGWPKTRQIATGHCGPAVKRTKAIEDAQGEILVFIDDDAYPETNFLDILEQDFLDEKVIAVGGPALTPPSDSFWQKVSGAVFLSALSGGCPERYASVGKRGSVDDWPSVNFSIRKEKFGEIGGFNGDFWPGEDTKLCLDLIKKYPKSIIYNPQLIVYHHRRAGLGKHLKQVGGYGLHRGFFAKRYPENSFKLIYFVPSFFLLFVVLGGILSFYSEFILLLYLIGWAVYGLAMMKAFHDIHKHEKNLLIISNALYCIFLTHLVYGANFIRGFVFTKNLISKLR